MTWLLVSTRPLLLITMPVASAVPPTYCRLLWMSTTPGSTALAMACSWELPTPEPEFEPLPGLNPPLFGLKPLPGLLPGFSGAPELGEFCEAGDEWSRAATAPAPTPA